MANLPWLPLYFASMLVFNTIFSTLQFKNSFKFKPTMKDNKHKIKKTWMW